MAERLAEADCAIAHRGTLESVPRRLSTSLEREAMPRELIDTGNDKRYVRRNAEGQFSDVVDVGKSLAADRRTKAKTVAKKGEGDRGDQKR